MTYDTVKILIVEDDPFIAMDLEAQLVERSLEVVAKVPSVDEAAAVLESRAVEFALLDYNLGDTTSAPIAAKLAEKQIPFIYLTGQDASILEKDGAPAGIVVPKTAPIERIVELVTRPQSPPQHA